MSAVTIPNLPNGITTLQDLAAFAASGKGSLDEVSNALTAPIDLNRFDSLRKRIDIVAAAKRPTGSRKSKAVFSSAQGRLKGKLFEQLIGLVLQSSYAFSIYGNVQTLTNEVDWLVYLGPLRIMLPAMTEWGTHVLCECKMHKTAMDGNWVTRLYAMTQTHGTRVAILFTAKELGTKGNSGKPLRAIQDMCILANPAFIVRVGLEELAHCVHTGRSPLALLCEKYNDLKSRRAQANLITM